ncbi:MAG: hypothetical protein P1U39_06345 [Legionellaceae bacterium]|nr:hypothetical protein [Legionellaceae bacterium]
MSKKIKIPAFVSTVTLVLGCLDLVRGFMHTFKLEYAALHIAKLNLSTPEASDLLQLLGVFGVSNYITGIMLILVALRARELALVMLFVIPLAYVVGGIETMHNSHMYAASQAAWGGRNFMFIYLIICVVTFVAGLACALYRWKIDQPSSSRSQRV